MWPCLLLLAACVAVADVSRAAEVLISADRPLQAIAPGYFGISTDGHHESPAARADGRVVAALRALPCRLVRFPGGTESDNYLWDEHRWWDPRMYPHAMARATATCLAAADAQHPQGNDIRHLTPAVARADGAWVLDLPAWSLASAELRPTP